MNWKKWKLGLVIAIITGMATGALGLAVGITLQQAGILLVVSIAKDVLLFIKTHPPDDISDTSFFAKPPEPPKT